MEGTKPAVRRVLACPVCGVAMESLRRGLIEVDRCGDHGVWLDRGELEQVVKTGRGHGARRARFDAQAARREGRVQGSVFGWISLLFD